MLVVRASSILFVTVVGASIGCFTDMPPASTGAGNETTSTTATTSEQPTTSGATTTATSSPTVTTDPGSSTEVPDSTSGVMTVASDSTTSDSDSTTDSPLGPGGCQPKIGLVACYDFETLTPQGVQDASANGHLASVMSVAFVEGRYGQGLQTTEESVVLVADAEPLNRGQDWTWMAWVRPAQSPNLITHNIISRGTDYSMGIGMTGVMCRSGGVLLTSDVHPPVNDWTHLACVRTANSFHIYMNGQEIKSSEMNEWVEDANKTGVRLANASINPSAQQAFVGVLDDVMLWNVSLAQADVCQFAGIAC